MNKIRTTITIDKELLEKAKKNNIPISSFLDIELRRYLCLVEQKPINNSSNYDDSWACSLDWIGRQPPKL
jgi:hypothetical protein